MTWLKIFVLQLSPSDADIVTSDTAKIEEAKQEARKMNIAVLAVSLLYVLDIIFFTDVDIFILFISFNLAANYMTLTQFASYQ